MPTTRGPRGRTGQRGARGSRGPEGARGPAGPVVTRDQMLAAVQSEFDTLRKDLRVQLERTAQMQLQLDAIQKLLERALQDTQR